MLVGAGGAEQQVSLSGICVLQSTVPELKNIILLIGCT